MNKTNSWQVLFIFKLSGSIPIRLYKVVLVLSIKLVSIKYIIHQLDKGNFWLTYSTIGTTASVLWGAAMAAKVNTASHYINAIGISNEK